ncbi:hypothetical protein SAMN02745196_00766 [Clostridium collagenovorans DSM 3089]|uniref:Polymerase/histidinol phosphatase N-terminal domain-containing protein n=1 Tax=Clostridium collagenovorans DSM 3089 TaxID=1121306 RepID=A0A1M5TXR8_9CLOT|nr:PHP domain-containing protein [Clostridium collagenovorans]SHH55625.1 hypothetical protein SAMN02745196_00766 [Clostridium collagenovorans DSM 3089]
MSNTKGDFHIHSTISDGRNTPYEILSIAQHNNIDFLALTDHDNTDGVNDFLKYAKAFNITAIPGIELSTVYNKENIHVLGFFKDSSFNSKEFQDFLKKVRCEREVRAKKIIENLKTYFDISIEYEQLLKLSKGTIARPHIAQAIIDKGYSYSYQYIFDNIISTKSPAYVPYNRIDTKEGINLLKSFNALTVLAHPVLIKISSVKEILQFGFDGIEAIYPLNTKEDEENFKALAKKYNLFITAGSDFHGNFKDDTKHSNLGSVYLENTDLKIFLEKLKSNS